MKIQYIKGDLLKSNEPVIAHGCNAQGVMRSGIAKAIRAKHPIAYEDYVETYSDLGGYLPLGGVIKSYCAKHNRWILNIISQQDYGRDSNVIYVSYEAIRMAIKKINTYNFDRVAFPLIGAGLANGNWDTISSIIESEANFTPVVYILE